MSYSDITESSYIPSTNTQVFVSDTPFDETEEATSVILTLAGAVSVGQTSMTVVTGVDRVLYEGTRIPFDNGAVYVSTKTAANSTTIPIHPSKIAINSGSIARLTCYIPLLSFKSINVDHQNQEFTDQVFESAEVLKGVSGIITTGSSSGAEIWGDPGLALIKEAHYKRKALRVQILDPGFKGYQEFDSLFSFGNSSGVNSYKQISINLSGIGVRELPPDPPLTGHVNLLAIGPAGVAAAEGWHPSAGIAANLCGASSGYNLITPFSFSYGYPSNLLTNELRLEIQNAIKADIIANARWLHNNGFLSLVWNGQASNVVMVIVFAQGAVQPGQTIIDKILQQGGVYATTTCVVDQNWYYGNSPVYSLIENNSALTSSDSGWRWTDS